MNEMKNQTLEEKTIEQIVTSFENWGQLPLRYKLAEVGFFIGGASNLFYNMYRLDTGQTITSSPGESAATMASLGYLIGNGYNSFKMLWQEIKEANAPEYPAQDSSSSEKVHN